MPDWDKNSPDLNRNIAATLDMTRKSAMSFQEPTLDLPKKWQARIMQGLTPQPPANKSWFGKFRGEPGQEFIEVAIGPHRGTPPDRVAAELDTFIKRTKKAVALLDRELLTTNAKGKTAVGELDDAAIRTVIGLMAFVH